MPAEAYRYLPSALQWKTETSVTLKRRGYSMQQIDAALEAYRTARNMEMQRQYDAVRSGKYLIMNEEAWQKNLHAAAENLASQLDHYRSRKGNGNWLNVERNKNGRPMEKLANYLENEHPRLSAPSKELEAINTIDTPSARLGVLYLLSKLSPVPEFNVKELAFSATKAALEGGVSDLITGELGKIRFNTKIPEVPVTMAPGLNLRAATPSVNIEVTGKDVYEILGAKGIVDTTDDSVLAERNKPIGSPAHRSSHTTPAATGASVPMVPQAQWNPVAPFSPPAPIPPALPARVLQRQNAAVFSAPPVPVPPAPPARVLQRQNAVVFSAPPVRVPPAPPARVLQRQNAVVFSAPLVPVPPAPPARVLQRQNAVVFSAPPAPELSTWERIKNFIEDKLAYLAEWLSKQWGFTVDAAFKQGGEILSNIVKAALMKLFEHLTPLANEIIGLAKSLKKIFEDTCTYVKLRYDASKVSFNAGHPQLILEAIQKTLTDSIKMEAINTAINGLKLGLHAGLGAATAGSGSLLSTIMNAVVSTLKWIADTLWLRWQTSNINKIITDAQSYFKNAQIQETGKPPVLNPNSICFKTDEFSTFFKKVCDASSTLPCLILASPICGSLMVYINLFTKKGFLLPDSHRVEYINDSIKLRADLRDKAINFLKSSNIKLKSDDPTVGQWLNAWMSGEIPSKSPT